MQTYYLVLLDLEKRKLLDVRQLDLNKQEYLDSNDPEIIYSSEIYIDEVPIIENDEDNPMMPFGDPLELAGLGATVEEKTQLVIR